MKKLVFLFFPIVCCGQSVEVARGAGVSPRVAYGVARLKEVLKRGRVVVDVRPDSVKEGFSITEKGGVARVVGNDASGALYGCLELAERIRRGGWPTGLRFSDRPEMVLRGACIGVQKPTLLPGRGPYEYPYTPENFPWFYDKALWTKYLDSMAVNRMNTLYLWNGHPFASLVRLKDYPYAVEVDEATFRKNEEMYRWLTTEADRRGIWVIQLFYNIIVSKPFAEKNGLKTQDRSRHIVPIIADYTRKSIAAFVEKYPNVGLMFTLGEAMEGVGQDDIDWLTRTIIPGIKDGLRVLGRSDEPPVVLRAHDTDGPADMRAALPLYKNLFVEAKFNGEALTTYTPRGSWAELHRQLSHISRGLIENVHIMANLEPFRYGSAEFIQRCVQAMHSVYGANSLHLYPQASYWDWPYSADSVDAGSRGVGGNYAGSRGVGGNSAGSRGVGGDYAGSRGVGCSAGSRGVGCYVGSRGVGGSAGSRGVGGSAGSRGVGGSGGSRGVGGSAGSRGVGDNSESSRGFAVGGRKAAGGSGSGRLLEMERDWIWYKEWARYAWNCHRDRKEEVKYWSGLLAAKFGCDTARGGDILEAYEQSGEIAPKLLRRYGITDGNRQTLTLGMLMTQLIDPERYGLFSLLYESEGPPGEMLGQYAEREWKGLPHEGETPVEVAKEVREEGKLAVEAMGKAADGVTRDREEFGRLRNDMNCYQALADCYAAKAEAALAVLRYKYSGDAGDLRKALGLLEESVAAFRELTRLAGPAYRYANSMQTPQRKIPVRGANGKFITWGELLPVYENEVRQFRLHLAELGKVGGNEGEVYRPAKVVMRGDGGNGAGDDGGVKRGGDDGRAKRDGDDGGVKRDGDDGGVKRDGDDGGVKRDGDDGGAKGAGRFKVDSAAMPYSDSSLVVRAVATSLRGLEGVRQSVAVQREKGTLVEWECSEPVDLLIGFFNKKGPAYLQPPQLETDASANDFGQAEPRIANALVVEGAPSVNVHVWSFRAGKHRLELGKGLCLVLGFARPMEKVRTYDAGMNAPGKKDLDWLFE